MAVNPNISSTCTTGANLTYDDATGVLNTTGIPAGPATSTDNAVARFNGTDGSALQNSVVLISDTGAVTGVTDLTTTGNTILGDATGDTLAINPGAPTAPNLGAVTAGTILVKTAGNVIGTNSAATAVNFLTSGTNGATAGPFTTVSSIRVVNGLVTVLTGT